MGTNDCTLRWLPMGNCKFGCTKAKAIMAPSLKSVMMIMGDKFCPFLIMMYKGFLIRKHCNISTLIEGSLPLLVASIALIVAAMTRSLTPYVKHSDRGPEPDMEATFYPPFNPFDSSVSFSNLFILYTPDNHKSKVLIEKASNICSKHFSDLGFTLRGYETEKELETDALIMKDSNKEVLGTVLLNFPRDDDDSTLPSSLDYKIRYEYSYSFNLLFKYFTEYRPYHWNQYKDLFFLAWQASIEQAFINLKSNKSEESGDFKVTMQRFPYPPYQSQMSPIVRFISAFIVYGYLLFFCFMVCRVVQEKANHSKELLKMMGMTDGVYWCSTFFNSFLFGGAIAIIMTSLYKIPLDEYNAAILNRTGFFAMLLVTLLYLASSILLYLVVTTFFKKPNVAVFFTNFLHIVTYHWLMMFVFEAGFDAPYLSLTPLQKYAVCLLPNGALQAATMLMSAYETLGVEDTPTGIMSFNMHSDFTLTGVILMMLFSCFIYSIMLWYLDAAWPWQFGAPRPLYFPFTKSYWCNPIYKSLTEDDWSADGEFFEKDPEGVIRGVTIRNLTKTFHKGSESKTAVDNVSMNIYCGQITALVGRNGAGKTTMINILTGLFLPNSGTVLINGWDMHTHTKNARTSFGICPQDNVLYDFLTVEDHLKIYAVLKGVKWAQLSKAITNTLRVVKLEDKRNVLCKKLSVGMKRKLSLGIAIIGGSKVLFLDEPTSGMDPEACQSLWDILLSLRVDRTIVLTTHCMEEADILGDRIAIMADGKIQCSGTPMFLKKKFGTGYRLHILKDRNCDVDSISKLLRQHIPQVTLESSAESSALVYSFGDNTAGSGFGTLFQNLETAKEELRVISFGITATTMDDVFLRVSFLADEIPDEESDTESVTCLVVSNDEEIMVPQYEKLHAGPELWIHKFKGLLFKRLIYARRHWTIFIWQAGIPFLLMVGLMASFQNSSLSADKLEKSLKLDLHSVYGKTKGVYNFPHHISELGSVYQSLLKDSDVDATQVDDPGAYALKMGSESIKEYKEKLSLGGVGSNTNSSLNVTAWYNGDLYHIVPIALNMMHVSLLRYFTNDMNASMTLTNSPFPSTPSSQNGVASDFIRALTCVFFPLTLMYVSGCYVLLPIKECSSKVKLLQLMTGISAFTYWLSMFVWDVITHILISLLLLIPFSIFAGSIFFPHPEAIGGVIAILLLFGWSILPFCYLISRIIQKPITGFTLIVYFMLVTGLLIPEILSIMHITGDNDEFTVVLHFLRLLPTFAATWGFSNLMVISYSNALCELISDATLNATCQSSHASVNSAFEKCCKDEYGNNNFTKTYPFTWDHQGCGIDMFYLFIDGLLLYTLLLFLETGILQRAFSKLTDIHPQRNTPRGGIVLQEMFSTITSSDSDVQDEVARMSSIGAAASQEEALVSKALTKYYTDLCAVDSLTFGIHKEECFGLLGINGAGKTSTFKMLTGDIYPTSGDAMISQTSVGVNLKQFQSFIGYCPQFDALIDRLTGREMLNLFASLRGITNIDSCVSKIIASVDLQEHANKQTRFYSGGNKRKLSVAMALIGSPPVIFLDEPTVRVDPISRRKIWNILSQTKRTSAIMLCTHSMEECEVMCDRLAIMVNGKFSCLGSIQHLKSKYGVGFTITVKLQREQSINNVFMTQFLSHVASTFKGAIVKDFHQCLFRFYIKDASIPWSYLFNAMEQMKQTFEFEDYLISGTTLEQIFLGFARNQSSTQLI